MDVVAGINLVASRDRSRFGEKLVGRLLALENLAGATPGHRHFARTQVDQARKRYLAVLGQGQACRDAGVSIVTVAARDLSKLPSGPRR